MTSLDFQNGLWLLSAPSLKGSMGFWSLASAMAFATKCGLAPKFTNSAIVAKFRG